MGVKTCEELIRRGVYLAGVTYKAADTKPLTDLKTWLRSVALGWPWPDIMGTEIVTLAAGDYRVGLGLGEDWATSRYLQRIDFPLMILYDENTLPDKVLQQGTGSMVQDEAYIPEGIPDRAGYARIDNGGAIIIIFNRKLKTALTMQIGYQYDPAVDYELDDVPWYVNDDTMEYAIAWKAAEAKDGPTAANTLKLEEALSTKLRNDKIKIGIIDSFTLKMNRKPQLT